MNAMGNITAAVLAGGKGLRLREAVSDRPKVLAAVAGKPFLGHILDQLAGAGIRRIALCTGYKGEMVEAEFGAEYRGMELVYSREHKPLDTAGALRNALPLVNSETLLAMNGDSFCNVDLRAFHSCHVDHRAEASIVLTRKPDAKRYGSVEIDAEGKIIAFREKGESIGGGWVSAGIYLIDTHLLHSIPVGKAVSIEKEVFPEWINRNFYGYKSTGKFIDIGTPEDYRSAENFKPIEEDQ